MAKRLPNYLRAYRRRTGLSQLDMAFLMGCHLSGAMVCRYERRQHEPNLRNAIAFEIIFGKSLRKLIAGTYEDVQRQIRRKADVLLHKLNRSENGISVIERTPFLQKVA